jgi:hypothetical protein
MAMTASVALSTSTPVPEQPFTVTLTVSNSGAASVNVIGIIPIVEPTGVLVRSVAASSGLPALGPNYAVAVAAGGSTNFVWSDAIHSPRAAGLTSGTSQAYDIGALVACSDGSLISATIATATVSAVLT